MTIELMLGLQILADVALCLIIIFLIRAVSREMKKRPPEIGAETFSEFSKLIEDSRRSTDHLFQALNEIKEIAYDLSSSEDRKSGDPGRGKKYEDVVKMTKQGMTKKEIADTLNLTEGEICLILDLHLKKNENSAPCNSIP